MSDLVFYAHRLKKEKVTRTFSAIAAVLIVGLQFATIAAPPTPSNAASSNDIIYGGFVSKDDMLNRYDGSSELQALYNYFGITRADLAGTHVATINSRDHSLLSIGRNQHLSSDTKVVLGSHTYWTRALYTWDTGSNVQNGSSYQVLEGTRARDGAFFAAIFHCGNIVFKTLPPKPTPPPPPKPSPSPSHTPSPSPKPSPSPAKPTITCVQLTGDVKTGEVPLTVNYTGLGSATGQTVSEYQFSFGDTKTANQPGPKVAHLYPTPGVFTATLKVKGSTGAVSPTVPACSFTVTVTSPPAAFTKAKSALNLTQNIDATTKPAQAGDVIRYTLTTKNVGGTADSYAVVEHIEDVMEYASVTDFGGATLQNGVMTWPAVIIKPGATLTKTFTTTVMNPIPPTPVGLSDKFSYDLRMDNVYGNTVSISLVPPFAKQVEGASTSLPAAGPGTASIIVLAISFITLFFYFRNRQLNAEVKLLRGQYQGGL